MKQLKVLVLLLVVLASNCAPANSLSHVKKDIHAAYKPKSFLWAIMQCVILNRIAVGPGVYSPPETSNCSTVSTNCQVYCYISIDGVLRLNCSYTPSPFILCRTNYPAVGGCWMPQTCTNVFVGSWGGSSYCTDCDFQKMVDNERPR